MEFKEFVEHGITYYHDEEKDIASLLKMCAYLGKDAEKDIIRAFQLAKIAHEGATREGGEPYMSHPYTVAMYAAFFRLSKETVIAGLFHDAVEDTNLTLQDIEKYFGKRTASLVDGVSKLKGIKDKEHKVAYNTSKLFRSFLHLDADVILLKLLDRVHNMSTIHNKKRRDKQIENAEETLHVFVPMARHLGCGAIRRVLEDYSLKCLNHDKYDQIQEMREITEKIHQSETASLMEKIQTALMEKGITGKLETRIKEPYGINRKLENGLALEQIHDLNSMRLVVDDVEKCYSSLAVTHQFLKPVQFRMKDYISCPKANMYQSFHTTGMTENGTMYQVRIRTPEMAEVAEEGICAYARQNAMTNQEALERDYQFYQDLRSLDVLYPDDIAFYKALKEQTLSRNIYINLLNGTLELPQNSTLLDLVCKLGRDELLHFLNASRNGEMITLGTVLKDHDSIRIERGEEDRIPPKYLIDNCTTPLAKGMIDSFYVPPKAKKMSVTY